MIKKGSSKSYVKQEDLRQVFTMPKGGGEITMAKTVRIARNAETGQFTTMDYAKKNPKTTVVEKIKVGPVKRHNK